ncbi:MAG TPA: PEP/pyruvate-binding domain-containing protein [Desulfobacterales bacterium]|nr:PEP/pyruvate-binding domain-containing protein [Desulfobacterales bacterium]
MVFIVGFEDSQALDPQIVGRKFASLAWAVREGFAVPEAVAIITKAHGHFLATESWPNGLRKEVIETARRLDIRQGVSIRSSATREDLAGQSFAGQYRSFLEVDSEREVLRRIEECWESAGSETVRSYLRAVNLQGSDTETPLLAVIVQRMVNSSVAGVAFSRNPLRPDRDEMVIEAVKGHAESLVSGHRSPCRARVHLDGRVSVESGSPSNLRLSRNTPWREIAGLLKRLEKSYGGEALDMEWAVDRGKTLWLLQVRPITALASEEELPPAGAWTRRIADDLWADRLEPFMAEVMLSHAPRFDLSRIARLAGITPVLPALTVINGYLYVNCDSIRRIIAHIPRPLRFKDLATLLPAGSPLSDIPPPRAWTLVRICLRTILLPLREPGTIPFICLQNTPRAIRRLRARMALPEPGPAATAHTVLERLQTDLETLALIQVNNQWPYFHATLFTWVLRWLAVDRLQMTGTGFLGLISQGSNNVTIGIEHWFRKTALSIGSDPGLQKRFLSETPSELAFSLPVELQAEVHGFLQRYGFRSRHRTLLIKRWAEAPEEVVGILQSLVRHPHAGGTTPKAVHPVTDGISPGLVFNRVLRLLAGVTRRFLDVREELRFLLDEALFHIRRDLLALGRLLEMEQTIFFLTPREIEELVTGRLAPTMAATVATQRQRRFRAPVEPGTFWVDGRPEYDFCAGGTVLRGIGTSPGRVTGRAVIVEDPAAAKIRRGDVVVARHTDPGWTPILSVIGGIVMEEGGLLNHCSIVARELGIPSIVGVSRATQLIPEGARVTIDGGAGVVKIEEG